MRNITKILFIVLSLTGVLALYSFTITHMSNPEKEIAGIWAEKKWEYEKVYHPDDKKELEKSGDYEIHISPDQAVLHMAEKWYFQKNGELILLKGSTQTGAKWKIKGRGNILEIEYDNGLRERYNITELDTDKMVLNFSPDIQIKGLTRLTFNRL